MVKAPFKISYDSPTTFRVWGYGLGYLPMGFLSFGYNLRGTLGILPFFRMWRVKRDGQPEIF